MKFTEIRKEKGKITILNIEKLENEMDAAFFALEDYSVELTGLAGEWERVAVTEKGARLLSEYKEAKSRYERAMKEEIDNG